MDRRTFSKICLASGLVSARVGSVFGTQLRTSESTVKVARGKKGVAATVHPLATEAAMQAFERGGNAIDAAVAASLMLSVVDIHNSGLGGGGLALIRTSDGKIYAIDGRERAPLKVSAESYLRNGKPDPSLSQTGPLAAATPGLPALLETISKRFGQISWRDGLLGAAAVAANGFAIDGPMARNLSSHAKVLSQFPATASVLLKSDGQAFEIGERLVQSDLAQTLESLADHGTKWFYNGPFAEWAEQLMQSTGGLLSKEDFAGYKLGERKPIPCEYRGRIVHGFPPPSSGGIHIAQMLTMLSQYNVQAQFAESPARGYHLLAEVMKRAMADRAHWLGDADYVPVPRSLIDKKYLLERAGDIDLQRSVTVEKHGVPPDTDTNLFGPGSLQNESGKHTTHLTAADAQGNVVALTQTVNTSFGSKMIVPGSGVLLNNEMDDFSLAPGVRNAFGLLGSAANAVAPGKRPLSSMSPTIVVGSDGQFEMSCGAAGGPKIITSTLQVLIRALDLQSPIGDAIAAPRIHHQWSPDVLMCEDAVANEVVKELERKGHNVQRSKTLAVSQGLRKMSDGSFEAASDPRVPSAAAGWDG